MLAYGCPASVPSFPELAATDVAGGEVAKNVILPGRVPGAFAVFPFHKQSGGVHGLLRL